MAADPPFRASADQREYEREWKKWFDSLPPTEQAHLREQGMDKPLREQSGPVTRKAAGERSGDAADRKEASERPVPSESLEDRVLEVVARQSVDLPAGVQRRWFNGVVTAVACRALFEAAEAGELAVLFDGRNPTTERLDMVTRVLAELMDADDPGLQAECLAFVLGLNVGGGRSETDIARGRGVGKAAVSKRCIRIREAFGLPPSRGMKSDHARGVFAKRQEGKRARPQRMPYAYTGFLKEVYEQA